MKDHPRKKSASKRKETFGLDNFDSDSDIDVGFGFLPKAKKKESKKGKTLLSRFFTRKTDPSASQSVARAEAQNGPKGKGKVGGPEGKAANVAKNKSKSPIKDTKQKSKDQTKDNQPKKTSKSEQVQEKSGKVDLSDVVLRTRSSSS